MQQPPNPNLQNRQFLPPSPQWQQQPDNTQSQTYDLPQQPPIPPKNRVSRTDKILFAVLGAVVSIFVLAVIIGTASTSATHDLNATATANVDNPTATAIANNATVSAGTTAITSDLTQTAITPTVDTTATAESNAVSTAIANSSAQLTAEALTPTTPPVTPTPTTDIGTTQDIGTWVVTLNKVYRATSGDYVTPKAGDIFIIVDVTAINEASTPELISSAAMFVFQDETGQAYQETITGIGVPPDGTIPAGGKLRGEISYEVPTSLHNFTLEFQDNLYNGNTETWSFSV